MRDICWLSNNFLSDSAAESSVTLQKRKNTHEDMQQRPFSRVAKGAQSLIRCRFWKSKIKFATNRFGTAAINSSLLRDPVIAGFRIILLAWIGFFCYTTMAPERKPAWFNTYRGGLTEWLRSSPGKRVGCNSLVGSSPMSSANEKPLELAVFFLPWEKLLQILLQIASLLTLLLR